MAEEQREEVRELLQKEAQQVLFLEYQPEPIIIEARNQKVFEIIIKEYMGVSH